MTKKHNSNKGAVEQLQCCAMKQGHSLYVECWTIHPGDIAVRLSGGNGSRSSGMYQ